MTSGDEHPEFPLLAFLWGCAHALSALSATNWFVDMQQGRLSVVLIADCAMFAAAITVIVRPNVPAVLGLLAGVQAVQTVVHLPEVPNHRILMFCLNLALLLALAANAVVRDRQPLRPALASTFSRVSLYTLAGVYFFATLAKLNTGFLDPDVSCGAQFLGHVTQIFPTLGFTQASAAIWLTIVVEGLLVPGLIYRKTRKAAVLVGLVFHFGVALDLVKRFYNFSAVMSAMLTASLGTGLLREAAGSLGNRFSRSFLGMVRILFAVWLAGLFAYGLLADPEVKWKVFIGAWSIWTLLGVFCIALAVAEFVRIRSRIRENSAAREPHARILTNSATSRRNPHEFHDVTTRPARVAVAVPLLLILANGCGPYLGYKTRTSFNMYSNLRLEANAGNHLLFSRSLDVCGYLADEVELLETNDEVLRRDYLDKGHRITHFELERHLAGRDPDGLHLVVRRKGRVEAIADVPRPGIGKRLLWKLLVFRPLGPRVVHECIW